MLILVDERSPEMARKTLEKYGDTVEFSTEGLVYDAICGHPDVFIIQFKDLIVTAPNLPDEYKILLRKQNLQIIDGDKPVGNKHPETARYNAVITSKYFIHNLKISDEKLLEVAANKIKIHVPQGYTRCNLLALNDKKMITSDNGIYKTLTGEGIETLYVSPVDILLPGFANGFIGGACGISGNRLFLLGKLKYHINGKAIKTFIIESGFEIIELYNGPLFDGGGIFLL